MFYRTGLSLIAARISLLLLALTLAACRSNSPAEHANGTNSEEAGSSNEADELAFEPATRAKVHANDARLGSDQARVTLIAFFDFECPYCASSYASLMKVRRKYSDEDLRIVFKHLPLNFHQSALPAAIAGQSVQTLLGSEAFFTFATLAFENQQSLSFEAIANWAEAAGVQRADYNKSVQDEAVFQLIVEDVKQAQSLGVRGTPAFYLNGKAFKGAQNEASLSRSIEAELKKVAPGLKDQAWSAAYAQRIEENLSTLLIDQILDEDPNRYKAIVGNSPTSGSKDALVTLVMFTDFECPYCRKMEPTLAALRVKYAADLRVVFKHAPLPFHELSQPAHQLAQAIYEEKGSEVFFDAAREIFLNSPEIQEPILLKVAERFGLDEKTAQAALAAPSASISAQLKADAELAKDLKANGTPHFFINGRRLAGARDRIYFEALIDHELAEAKKLRAEGIAVEEIYPRLMKEALLPGAPQKAAIELKIENHPISGRPDAPNIIHVFSDYECPYCRRGEAVLANLKEKYGDALAIVWHDLPLPFHQQAKPAARLARAIRKAGGDDDFWQAHARIFNLDGDAPALTDDALVEIGKGLGLSESEALSALSDESWEEEFDEDHSLAEKLGISGTPAFVVNGYLILGAQPPASFERVFK